MPLSGRLQSTPGASAAPSYGRVARILALNVDDLAVALAEQVMDIFDRVLDGSDRCHASSS
jgi:hypothetical protein